MSAPVDVLTVRRAANGSSVTLACAKTGATLATLKSDHPLTRGRKMENAERLAACFNALAGVPNPAEYVAAVGEMIHTLKQISAMRIIATGFPAVPDLSAERAQRLAEETLRNVGVYAP